MNSPWEHEVITNEEENLEAIREAYTEGRLRYSWIFKDLYEYCLRMRYAEIQIAKDSLNREEDFLNHHLLVSTIA